MSTPAHVLELLGVEKQYGALRPLRVQELRVAPGESVALMGLDASAAEAFVNLATGSALPDQGEVRAFGRVTAGITDGNDWLAWLDRFGILSDRAVLLETMTVAQNLAMPFTLDVDPIPAVVRSDVETLASGLGLENPMLDRLAGEVSAAVRARVRLGRAIALGAQLLLLEHPTASLDPADVLPFAADLRRLSAERSLTLVAVTADRRFAGAVASRVLKLVPGSGALVSDEGAVAKVKRLFGTK